MDKLLHIGACLLIALVVGLLWHPLAGVIVALAAGAGKELRDAAGHGTPSWADMGANLAGAVLGAGAALLMGAI